jgi:hypothetical protein
MTAVRRGDTSSWDAIGVWNDSSDLKADVAALLAREGLTVRCD